MRGRAAEKSGDGQKENVEVGGEANVLAIGEINAQLGREDSGEVIAVLVGLAGHQFFFVEDDGGASDAWPGGKDLFIRRGVLGGVARDFRPRADEAHMASENVEELRQFVDFGFA